MRWKKGLSSNLEGYPLFKRHLVPWTSFKFFFLILTIFIGLLPQKLSIWSLDQKIKKNCYFLLTYFILNTLTTLKAMKCKYVNNLVAIIMFKSFIMYQWLFSSSFLAINYQVEVKMWINFKNNVTVLALRNLKTLNIWWIV